MLVLSDKDFKAAIINMLQQLQACLKHMKRTLRKWIKITNKETRYE